MRGEYSEAYTGKVIGNARAFYRDAICRGLLTESPFMDVKIDSNRNPDRQRFIPADVIESVIDICPDPQWKLLIALARYGGLRVPSEPLALTWDDVDWERKRLTIANVKTAHHGKATRVCPLFPEIENAPAGSVRRSRAGCGISVWRISTACDEPADTIPTHHQACGRRALAETVSEPTR